MPMATPDVQGKVRLDAYLAAKLPQASRARLQASIKEGLVCVNGKAQAKASYAIRLGDLVGCSVLPPPPLEASPEELPLDIVYEDEHLLVINKVRLLHIASPRGRAVFASAPPNARYLTGG